VKIEVLLIPPNTCTFQPILDFCLRSLIRRNLTPATSLEDPSLHPVVGHLKIFF
jgi:hypothetical protein